MGDEVRHKLADACRDADFDEAQDIISRHPKLVDSARPGGRAGFAPIHQAAYYGHVEFLKFLLDAKADLGLKTADGKTARDIATDNERKNFLKLLDGTTPGAKAGNDSAMVRRWSKMIDTLRGGIDDEIWEEISAHPAAVNVIPPTEVLIAKINSVDDGVIVTTAAHSFPMCISVVFHRGSGKPLCLDGAEVSNGTQFFAAIGKHNLDELKLYDTAENASKGKAEGFQEVSGGDGAEFHTKDPIHASYGVIHQVAFYGNTDSLKRLAELPQCDLTLRSVHGDSILDIANHKMHKDFAKKAREVVERRFREISDAPGRPDIKLRQRLADMLNPLPVVPMRGLLSNIPERDGYFPARPFLAVDWMAKCRKEAHLKDTKGLDEDWLLARQPLSADPVLQHMVDYFQAALPTHRGPVQALSNFVQGGALLGLSAFPGVAKKYAEFKTEEDILEIVRPALYDLGDRIDAFTRSHDVNAREHRKILGEYCESKLTAALLEVEKIRAAGDMDPSTYDDKAADAKKSLLDIMSAHKGLGRHMVAAFNKLNDEIYQLQRRLVEFIEVFENHVGIAAGTDVAMGTNNHIFAMLGSNPGPGGGCDYGPAAFALKKTILFHPDCEMTPQATTEYAGGRRMQHLAARRPWIARGTFPASGDEGPDVVDRLPTQETCGWGWAEDFSEVNCNSLVGDPKISVYQSFYARKRNQLHGYLSVGFEEAIAREVVAGARCVLTGVRPSFSGRWGPGGHWVGREPGPRAPGIGELTINGDWHCTDKLKVGGANVAVGHLKPEDCTFDVILEFYNHLEGHARVEVHLPRCITREAIQHIFVTNDVLSNLKDGTAEMKNTFRQLRMGLVLPDGREMKISSSDAPPWSSETPATLTVCNSMQEFVKAQEAFYRRRCDVLREGRHKAEEDQTMEQFTMTRNLHRGMSFRTGSFLMRAADWLPRIDGEDFRRGIAVSFETNATQGIMIHFAARCSPDEALDGDDKKKDAFPKYCLAIGVGYNTQTRIGRVWPETREIVIRQSGGHCPASSLAAVAPGGDAKWQRYWAAVSYQGGRAFVLFGRVGAHDLAPPKSVKIFPATAGKSLHHEEFVPAAGKHGLSRPVFADGSPGAPPILNVRYVGFTTERVPVTIRGLHVYKAPEIEIGG